MIEIETGEKEENSSTLNPSFKNIIKLNVGGKIFITTLSTLLKYQNSFFHKFFSIQKFGMKSSEMIEDSYFLDRDPHLFKFILLFLRYFLLFLFFSNKIKQTLF
jgi:hypothetical protein